MEITDEHVAEVNIGLACEHKQISCFSFMLLKFFSGVKQNPESSLIMC